MIRVRNLVKTFGSFTAVDDVSFDVEEGEIFAFLGPNGAGKTTTIKMLTTLLKPTSGQATINGYSGGYPPDWEPLYQVDYKKNPDVRDALAEWIRARHLPPDRICRIIDD